MTFGPTVLFSIHNWQQVERVKLVTASPPVQQRGNIILRSSDDDPYRGFGQYIKALMSFILIESTAVTATTRLLLFFFSIIIAWYPEETETQQFIYPTYEWSAACVTSV